MVIRIELGFPDDQRAQAAALYWQAFSDKLGAVMGPDRRALPYLHTILRPDHAIAAFDERGTLCGIAGFKTPMGSFAGGEFEDLARGYGWLGAGWRAPLLSMLSREIDNVRFLIDGICVAPAHRSAGIGSALIAALANEGRKRGYGEMRLDVIDRNTRARALYERLGFTELKTDQLGLLRHVFGFAASTSMVKPL